MRTAWAKLAERAAPIDGGSFDLAIADANGRFNAESPSCPATRGAVILLNRIAETAGVPRETVVRAVALIKLYGPITDLRPLEQAGLAAADARLASRRWSRRRPMTARSTVNAAKRAAARDHAGRSGARARLAGLRQQRGYLTRRISLERARPCRRGGRHLDLFWVRTRACIGDTVAATTCCFPPQEAGRQRGGASRRPLAGRAAAGSGPGAASRRRATEREGGRASTVPKGMRVTATRPARADARPAPEPSFPDQARRQHHARLVSCQPVPRADRREEFRIPRAEPGKRPRARAR